MVLPVKKMNMKKTILLFVCCIIMALSMQSYGQGPITEVAWRLDHLNYNDVDYYNNPTIHLQFIPIGNDYKMTTSLNLKTFSSGVEFGSNPEFLTTINPNIIDSDCEEYCDLDAAYFDGFFYNEGISKTFDYYIIIIDQPDGLILVMTDEFGNEATYLDSIILSVDNEDALSFDMYPNPVSNQLFVSSESATIESISVYSLQGQQIKVLLQDDSSLDVSFLSSGMYFIEVSTSEGKSVQKFIKK